LRSVAAASPPAAEVIVVDDGSTDRSAEVASSFGVRLLRLEQNSGAAVAKNAGARAALGDTLVFIDSDIVAATDLFACLESAFTRRRADGIVGLLDEEIPPRDWATRYKNLWMHFTYARFAGGDVPPRIGLFYTSIAAMRRERFLELGGFDENYRGASIAEDTEFGQRAWSCGLDIFLEPSARVVHLKTYSPLAVLQEDFRRARALTLMRLRKRGQPFFTSVPVFYQLAVPAIYAALACSVLAMVLRNGALAGLALVGVAALYLLNAPWLGFLLRKRGLSFAIKSALFLPLDVLVVGLGMARALADWVLRVRY
jgi:glycosyltransferase involved in cell wall biosynthesis